MTTQSIITHSTKVTSMLVASIVAATSKLDKVLTDYGIAYFYKSYDGDHLNRIAERLQTKMLPFFSQNRAFEEAKR